MPCANLSSHNSRARINSQAKCTHRQNRFPLAPLHLLPFLRRGLRRRRTRPRDDDIERPRGRFWSLRDDDDENERRRRRFEEEDLERRFFDGNERKSTSSNLADVAILGRLTRRGPENCRGTTGGRKSESAVRVADGKKRKGKKRRKK